MNFARSNRILAEHLCEFLTYFVPKTRLIQSFFHLLIGELELHREVSKWHSKR